MLLWLCLAATLHTTVVRVTDGDTLVVQGTPEIRVRLAQIDAPERKQTFGMEAKAALMDLTQGRHITVEYEKTDRYGRVIGQVYVDGVDVNLTMVTQGMAWVYRDYPHTDAYIRAETTAREHGVGLWADAHATPPWVFRRSK